jgi:hypothetical protein
MGTNKNIYKNRYCSLPISTYYHPYTIIMGYGTNKLSELMAHQSKVAYECMRGTKFQCDQNVVQSHNRHVSA